MDIYQEKNAAHAEKTVKASLIVLDLPIRGSYNPNEVCKILGIVDRTFWRLCRQYGLNDKGKLIRPDCLKSLLLGTHRRVSFLELVDFIRRNDETLRKGE